MLIFEKLTVVEKPLIADEHVREFFQGVERGVRSHRLGLLSRGLCREVKAEWRTVRNFGRSSGKS